jgi:hypothetical protein
MDAATSRQLDQDESCRDVAALHLWGRRRRWLRLIALVMAAAGVGESALRAR